MTSHCRKLILAVVCAACAWAADDPWQKVKDLKTGTEVRIYKSGVKQPMLAKFSDATDENLIITTKNEESAIPKEEIDRIDYRPPAKSSRVRTETRTKTDPDAGPVGPRPTPGTAGPSTSTNSSINMGSGKADFETLYRRTATARAK